MTAVALGVSAVCAADEVDAVDAACHLFGCAACVTPARGDDVYMRAVWLPTGRGEGEGDAEVEAETWRAERGGRGELRTTHTQERTTIVHEHSAEESCVGQRVAFAPCESDRSALLAVVFKSSRNLPARGDATTEFASCRFRAAAVSN
jgi:hypothetical protein